MRWGGGPPHEEVVAEKFVPSLESLSSLGFVEKNLGCPEHFAGMSQTPGGVQKVCAKKVHAHLAFPREKKGREEVLENPLSELENFARLLLKTFSEEALALKSLLSMSPKGIRNKASLPKCAKKNGAILCGWGGECYAQFFQGLNMRDFLAIKNLRNGQVSLIFGVPKFCAFWRLVLYLFKVQVEAKSAKIRDTKN